MKSGQTRSAIPEQHCPAAYDATASAGIAALHFVPGGTPGASDVFTFVSKQHVVAEGADQMPAPQVYVVDPIVPAELKVKVGVLPVGAAAKFAEQPATPPLQLMIPASEHPGVQLVFV